MPKVVRVEKSDTDKNKWILHLDNGTKVTVGAQQIPK